MLNFEISPSVLFSGVNTAVIIFAVLIFIILPLALAIIEYRVTKKDKKHGLYFLIGVFASTVLFGIFSVLVGILLTVIYFIAKR